MSNSSKHQFSREEIFLEFNFANWGSFKVIKMSENKIEAIIYQFNVAFVHKLLLIMDTKFRVFRIYDFKL